MNATGWGMGLALLAVVGCASVPHQPGIGDLKQGAFPLTRSDGSARERGQLFVNHRVALDRDRAEVGHVHLDKAALAAYFNVSGARDLGQQALDLAKTVQGIRGATDRSRPDFWDVPANDPVTDVLLLGSLLTRNVMDSVADAKDRDLEPLAVEFNRRLAKRLNLALGEAWFSPTPQRRDALPQAKVAVAENAGLDDWAADYWLLPSSHRTYNLAYFPFVTGMLQPWMAGGRPLKATAVADFMRDQGMPSQASGYTQGRALAWTGSLIEDLGILATVGGAAFFAHSGWNSRGAASAGGLGLAAALIGVTLCQFGGNEIESSVKDFNQALLGAVTLRAAAVAKGAP
jgi:hypothetical protein